MARKLVHQRCMEYVHTKLTTRILSFIMGCMFIYGLTFINFRTGSLLGVHSGVKQVISFKNKLHSRTVTDDINTSLDFDTTVEHDPGQTSRQKSTMRTIGDRHDQVQLSKVIERYTYEEYKQRAKTNQIFLDTILNQDYLLADTKEVLERYLLDKPYSFSYNVTLKGQLNRDFSIYSDIIVFLHIQKTGGTHLNNRFLRELQVPFQCKHPCGPRGPCDCLNSRNNMWFYTNAFATKNCGLHADWTQMHKCIPGLVDTVEQKKRQRRYFYFTQLRDAVDRYLSEFHHQTSRGHWQDAILGCALVLQANQRDVKPCFHGPSGWRGVSIEQFMTCKDNLATHRMTRMLSDLTIAGCYKNFTDETTMKQRASIWLESAKNILQTMEYIGLMEEEAASDKLFYQTYNLSFRRILSPAKPRRASASILLTEEQFLKALTLTELDIHIYLFGRDLFYKRLRDISL